MWHGFYVKDGRLRQDTFPMTQTRDSSFKDSVFGQVVYQSILSLAVLSQMRLHEEEEEVEEEEEKKKKEEEEE